MRKFFKNVLYSGIQDRLAPEDQVKLLFINSIIFFGLLVLTFFGVRDLSHGDMVLGGVTLAISSVVLALFFLIRVTKTIQIGAWFLPFLMFGFFTFLTASGGANSTVVLWILVYPIFVVFLIGSFWGSVFAAVFLAVQALLLFVPGLSPAAAVELEFKTRLIGVYAIVFTFSLAFEIIRLQAQKELTRTASELAGAKVQTDGILNTVTEGIFLLNPDLTIGDQHSHSLKAMVGKDDLTGRSFLEELRGRISEKDYAAAKDYLDMFFLPDPPWHLMEEINPLSETTITGPDGLPHHMTFSFRSVELSTGRRVLGTVRDVTESFELNRKLKEEEDRSARQMKHLFQIIHVKPELLLQFLQDADQEITAVNRHLKDQKTDPSQLIEELFQAVHAVKGNAALVGLSAFAARVHALENMVAAFREKKPLWQDFLEMTVQLSLIQAELTEIRELLGRMSAFQRGIEASSADQDLLLLALEKAIDQLGTDTKLAVDLDISEFQPHLIPEKHRKLIKDVLVQLVRNSYAHGLEHPSERKTAGKPGRPRIRVATTPAGPLLKLAYWDDGRGIAPEALSRVFEAGFSTAASVGLHAGRGVGLSLVKQRVETAGGRLSLRSVQGKGVAFDITLPLS